ncbi:MAG: thioredoxin domain-containing protein [Alphaproteobacteria bacterium]|nr:thioredoxin domain-containing protein [Alphaproteobacteria bacterium]
MKKSLVISVLALLVAVAAFVKDYLPCAKQAADSAQATVSGNVDVEAVLKEHPEYVVNALQAFENKAREEMEAQAKALVKASEKALVEDNAPYHGAKDSEIVMVEFYDYACGYCRRLYPELNQILAKNSDVKVLYRPLAFVSPYSEYAAKAVLAANEQGKFNELHTALFTVQKPLSEELVDELAEKAGLDVAKMKEDMKSDKVSTAFEANNALAEKIQIGGVPTLILNGEMLQPSPDFIQNKINEAKK